MSADLQIQCPIIYLENNLIFTNTGGCYAVYKLGSFNYEFRDSEAKIEILVRQVSLLRDIKIAKLLIVPTAKSIETHAAKIRRDILGKNQKDPLHNEAANYLEQTTKHLDSLQNDSWKDYTCYLLVKLQYAADSQGDLTTRQLMQALARPVYTLTMLLGLSSADIPIERYRNFQKLENGTYKTLGRNIELKRAAASELQWLLKHSTLRGTGKVPRLNRTVKTDVDGNNRWYKYYSADWSPAVERGRVGKVDYFRPNQADVTNLFEGKLSCYSNKSIDNKYHGVQVTHADGTVSYQSFVVITNIPDELQFPGKEWIYTMQKLPQQLEICIDIENIVYKRAKDELNKKGREIQTQYEETVSANVVIPRSLDAAQQQLDTMRQELEDNKLPMSNVRISICMANSNDEHLGNDVKQLIETLADLDFTAVCPVADQLQLWYQHLPGTGCHAQAFNRKISPFMLACGIFGASNSVGDDVGYYIGHANGKPVFLRLGLACLSDSSPAAVLYGSLGEGKSFAANLLLFLHVLFGAYGLVICPKGERAHWQKMPILGKYVNLVAFSPDPSNKGKLDPYNIFRGNISEASALAADVLTSLLAVKPNSDESVILQECINRANETAIPSMEAVIREIEKVSKNDLYYAAAYKLQRILRAKQRSGLVQLFFGDGSEEAIDINGRLNVIMLNGITLPGKGKVAEQYTQPEREAALLMSVLASVSKKFSHLHPGTEKLTLIDESWAITPTESGSALIDYHARMGRSLYHVLLLNGHSVLDLPSEKLRGAITYKFCFNPKDKAEAVRMLEFMRLDQSEENINELLSLNKNGRKGECLFSDLYGRVAKLTFDPVFSEILEFFSTTPKQDDDSEPSLEKDPAEAVPSAIPIEAILADNDADNTDESSAISDEELDKLIADILGEEL